jgi:hypothetical protein
VSTAISTLLSGIPLISIIGVIFGFIGNIFSKIIIYLWLVFDYIIVFMRELLMPLLSTLFSFVKKALLWVWKLIFYVIRLFIPECKADKEYCLRFDENRSYNISLATQEEFKEQNKLYELSIYKYFQKKLDELYSKNKQELDKLLNKATQTKKNTNIQRYNDLLIQIQTKEANLQNNYYLSIDHHRLIIQRNKKDVDFLAYKSLYSKALHMSTISQEALL